MLKEIPGTRGFLASDDGKIYDQAFTERKQYKNKDGYSTATVLTDRGWVTYGVHRLVALAHIEPPGEPFLLTVNHKDCDKSNNAVTNLEWLTVQFNNVHYALTNQPTRPMILLWKGDESNAILAESINTAAELSGCSKDEIWNSIVYGNEINGYKFKHLRSSDPIPAHLRKTTIPNRDRLGMIPRSPTKMKDIHTGEVTFYPTMTAAAKAHGTLTGHLSAIAKTPRLSLFRQQYQVAYADREFRDYSYEHMLNATRWGIARPVTMERSDGKAFFYPSANEFIAQNELSKKAISVRLKRSADENKIAEYNGIRFAYSDLELITSISEESSPY